MRGAKNIARSHANMMKGIWENRYYNSDYATTLGKRNIGLVGYGTIGTRVAKMMAGFGAKYPGFTIPILRMIK